MNARTGLTRFIGHTTRGAGWVLPRHFRAVAMMGGIHLDLTLARIDAGTVDIELIAVLGAIVVSVPSHLGLEIRGESIVLTGQLHATMNHDATPPTIIRISGRTVMGRIEVTVVDSVPR